MSLKIDSYIDNLKKALRSHSVLLIILISAAILWAYIFCIAAVDFIGDGERPFRSAWGGYGQIQFFGFTINFSFEGYADHDYFYYTWGEQFLRGIAPYQRMFDRVVIDYSVYNTPYFFPPLYVYMCAIGLLLPIDPFGIGLIISLFGYFTALPVYGISRHISDNQRVGEISAFTYLFNPLVLYHSAYIWLNPAPFVFFIMLSLYLLIKGKKVSGTLAMVTAALFKQVAFFMLLPLAAILLKKSFSNKLEGEQTDKSRIIDMIDIRGSIISILIAGIYVVAVSFPFLFNLANYYHYIFVVPGTYVLTNLTTLPNLSQPISPAVILIYFGAPIEIIDIVNKATQYGIFLFICIIIIFPLMLLELRRNKSNQFYWRRMLFLTLLLLLCVHIFSPRGVYKYYFVALIPFFSILSVSSMISTKESTPKVTLSMILNPILLAILIIIPDRNLYLAMILLILLGYLFHRAFSLVHEITNYGFGILYKRLIYRVKRKEIPQDISSESIYS